ncbi:MAG: NrdJb, partial [Gammaproteobacteria bacterium]
MATIKIDKKMVDYRVEQPEDEVAPDAGAVAAKAEMAAALPRETSADGKVVRMHEKLDRPEMLRGSTYKVKTPVSDHAMYVTINDIV